MDDADLCARRASARALVDAAKCLQAAIGTDEEIPRRWDVLRAYHELRDLPGARSPWPGPLPELWGERNPHAKLTAADVREIRALAGTVSRAELSDRFGVCKGHICLIIQRKTWRHI